MVTSYPISLWFVPAQRNDGNTSMTISESMTPKRKQELGEEKRKKNKQRDDACALLAGMLKNVKTLENLRKPCSLCMQEKSIAS